MQRSPTDCGVSEYDPEFSTINRPWPTRGCHSVKKLNKDDNGHSKSGCSVPCSVRGERDYMCRVMKEEVLFGFH